MHYILSDLPQYICVSEKGTEEREGENKVDKQSKSTFISYSCTRVQLKESITSNKA